MLSRFSLRGFGFKIALALVILQGFAAAAGADTFDFFPVPSGNDYILGITPGPDGNVWFTEGNHNKIGKVTPAGVVTEYDLPNSGANPLGIAAGPDGNLWYVYNNTPKIGRISPDGVITEFPKSGSPGGRGIAAGPDGNMWFTTDGAVGRITTQGVVTLFPLQDGATSLSITAGRDGNVWFTAFNNQVGSVRRITPAGTITTFPSAHVANRNLTPGPDGNLWFSEDRQRYSGVGTNKVASITPAGAITEFPIDPSIQGNPNFDLLPNDITAAPDGALWFFGTVNNEVYRITTQGAVTKVVLTGNATLISSQPIIFGPDGNLWMTGVDRKSVV